MIGIKFRGRLGNQIFQYYFMKYMKSQAPNQLVFFTNPNHAYITKYFEFSPYEKIICGSRVWSLITRHLPDWCKMQVKEVHNFSKPRHYAPVPGTLFSGFYQTDWYFKQIPNVKKLVLKQEYRQLFLDKFGKMYADKPVVVVHIRRTDYMNYGKRDISLPMAYFKRQLDSIENIEQYQVIFVSDDIKHVKEIFDIKPNYYFSSESEIVDFQLIQNADIAIISNSSFAWWACYLSPKQNKVLAPTNWMGHTIGREHPRGVMTDKFEWRT